MTYAETNELVKAIDEIETWASAIARERAKESIEYDRVTRLEGFLREAKEKVFDKAAPTTTTFLERLASFLVKFTAILYFGFVCFCMGYFITIYSDGILFEVPGLVSYWVDFGGSQ